VSTLKANSTPISTNFQFKIGCKNEKVKKNNLTYSNFTFIRNQHNQQQQLNLSTPKPRLDIINNTKQDSYCNNPFFARFIFKYFYMCFYVFECGCMWLFSMVCILVRIIRIQC